MGEKRVKSMQKKKGQAKPKKVEHKKAAHHEKDSHKKATPAKKNQQVKKAVKKQIVIHKPANKTYHKPARKPVHKTDHKPAQKSIIIEEVKKEPIETETISEAIEDLEDENLAPVAVVDNTELLEKTQQLAESNETIARIKSISEELEAKLSESTGQRDVFEAKLAEMTTAYEELGRKTEELAQKNNELYLKSDEVSLKNNEMSLKIKELEFRNDELASKNDELAASNKEINDELAATKKEMSMNKDSLSSKVEEEARKNRELALSINELNQKNKEMNQLNENMSKMIKEMSLKHDELSIKNKEMSLKYDEMAQKNKIIEDKLNLHTLSATEAGKRVMAARNLAQTAGTKEEAVAQLSAKINAYEQWLIALSDEAGDCTTKVVCDKCRAIQKSQDKLLYDALKSLGMRT